jgi:hypothetical protein
MAVSLTRLVRIVSRLENAEGRKETRLSNPFTPTAYIPTHHLGGTMKKSLALIMILACAAPAAFGQASVRFTALNDQRLSFDGQPQVLSQPLSSVAGVVLPASGVERELTVHLLVCRIYDDACEIAGSTPLIRSDASVPRPFRVRAASRLGDSFGKGLELTLLVTPRSMPLPVGRIDRRTALRVSAVATQPIDVRGIQVAPPDILALKGACYIKLNRIEDVWGIYQTPRDDSPIEVGLLANVEGEVHRPPNTHAYLIVAPLNSDTRWIMDPKFSVTGQRFLETAWVGREGLDYGITFHVQGILTSLPLRPGPLGPDEWRRLENETLCAKSQELVVRRRVASGELKLLTLDEQAVDGSRLSVRQESSVTGIVADTRPGNALLADETVWILRRSTATVGWTVAALALPSRDGFAFFVPALVLPGGEHQIEAVASRTQLRLGETITEQGWYRLVNSRLLTRLSLPVQVNETQR